MKEKVQAEREEYGINEKLVEYVRQLDYATFREYDAKKTDGSGEHTSEDIRLNEWQVRHATLLVKAVKEINELRYVLCPRYMDDGTFWMTYFELVKHILPPIAYTWRTGDPLPASVTHTGSTDAFDYLGSQLRTFSRKASTVMAKAGESAGVDVSSYLMPQGGKEEDDSVAATHTKQNSLSSSRILESDPDLEEYLRVTDTSDINDVEQDDDLDLDQYITELSGQGVTSQVDAAAVDEDDYDDLDDDIEDLIKGLDEEVLIEGDGDDQHEKKEEIGEAQR